jgi:tetratricopeptide (TPR) repeat protein
MKFFSRRMIPFVSGLMAFHFCQSQPVNTDSLLKLLPSSPADKKITILLRLTRAFETADNSKTLLYGKEGIAMARANNDEASEALLWYEMGKSLLYYNRSDSGRKFFDQSLNMAKKLNDSAALGRAWNGIAYSLYGVDILDTAIAYAFIARKFMKPEQNPVDYSYNCQLLGVAYSDLGNLSTSQKYFSEGLQYAEKSGDKVRYAEMSMHFGSSYIRHHRYAEAQKWIAKAADLFARTEDSYGLYASYNALGRIAIALGDHDAAMNYHEKSLELSRQRNDTYSIAIELTNTGKILLERGDYAASLERLSEAARITRESRSLYAQRAVYESLNDYYIATKKFDSATYYRDLYRAMFDSISSENITGKVADMQVKYETEKKEKALAHQQLLVAQQDARISRQQFTLAILAGALIILLGGGWLFYNRYRLRQKLLLDTAIIREQKQGLKAVIEAQDNERRRIAKDLHDGIAQELVALKFAFIRLSKKLIPKDAGEKEIMNDLSIRWIYPVRRYGISPM